MFGPESYVSSMTGYSYYLMPCEETFIVGAVGDIEFIVSVPPASGKGEGSGNVLHVFIDKPQVFRGH